MGLVVNGRSQLITTVKKHTATLSNCITVQLMYVLFHKNSKKVVHNIIIFAPGWQCVTTVKTTLLQFSITAVSADIQI